MLYSWDWVLDFVKACAKMAVIWVISTILAIVLDSCGIRAENLLLVYLLGVLISILATSSLAWALCAAIVLPLRSTISLRSQSLPSIWMM